MDEKTSEVMAAAFGAGAGVGSLGMLWAYATFSARCGFWAPVVRGLPQREGVALTFDDGPDEKYTPRVLDILGEAGGGGVKATFFVIGKRAAALPSLIKRIHAEGHTVGNHSLDHERFRLGRGVDYWRRQIGETQKIVAEITGELPVMFRPPWGYKTRALGAVVGDRGLWGGRMPVVGWSVKGEGIQAKGSEDFARRLLGRIGGHDIVLLQDGVAGGARGNPEMVVGALPGILRGVAEKKLKVVGLVEALVAGSEDIRLAAKKRRARAG